MVLPGFSKLGSFLIEKKYAEGKSANELDAIEKDRLKQYGTMCSLGLANMFWNGANNVLKELNVKKNEDWILNSIIFFTCSLVLMMIGLVASTFPESAPYPTFFAGWGAWAAVLCMLGSYHLDLVPFFASPMDALVSMIVTSTVFTLYWSYGAQDPWFVHLLGRFVWWIIQCIWNLIVSLYNKVAAAVGKLFKRSPILFGV